MRAIGKDITKRGFVFKGRAEFKRMAPGPGLRVKGRGRANGQNNQKRGNKAENGRLKKGILPAGKGVNPAHQEKGQPCAYTKSRGVIG